MRGPDDIAALAELPAGSLGFNEACEQLVVTPVSTGRGTLALQLSCRLCSDKLPLGRSADLGALLDAAARHMGAMHAPAGGA